MNRIYLDTNLVLDFLVRKEGEHFSQAQTIFEKIENGELKVLLSVLVVNEAIWATEKFYKIKRDDYFQDLINLFSLKGIKTVEIKKKDLFEIFKILWQKNVSFPDAYLYWLSRDGQMASFDKHFVQLGAKIYHG